MLWREAAEVYRKDLTLHPRNVWALVGLKNVLPELGRGRRRMVQCQVHARGSPRENWE